MHTLWRHKNQTWYVLYGPRQRRQISTQTKDRGEAEQFLARFIATANEPTTALPTFGAILDAYYADKANNADEARRVRSPRSMLYGIKGLQPLKDLYPSQLTPTAIRSWAKNRAAAAGTILREVGIARAALEWGVEHKWCAREHVPPISNPVGTPRARDRWLTKPEARALLLATQEAHVRVFVTLGLHTLARSGAMLEARWTQVNWERRTIDFGAGHGNKRRVIAPLNDELFPVLQSAHRLSCSSYIVEWRGGAVQSIRNGFTAAVRRAGLSDDVTPHILRHSGASWMVEAGVPDEEVARMLGDTVDMVRRVYGHFSPNYLKRASSALKLGTETEHPP